MLKILGEDVRAVSVGGLETCIELPGWGLNLDIGRCPPTAVRQRRVLLTHTHMDHAGAIAMHASTRGLMGMPPAIVYVPRENEEDLRALFDVWRRLDKSDVPCEIVPCGPGDRVPLGGKRVAVPFRSPHRVRCQGYALVATRSRLLPDLAGRPQEEIRRRRHAGEVVSEDVDVVELAFTGDTLVEVIEREPLVRQARRLVIEVTFLDDRVPVEAARAKGHVHLDEIVARADLLTNEALLFTHFSARYQAEEIVRILDEKLPAGLRARVTPLLPGSRG
ncbi:MAG: MBL fold metallo-hydrolase [Myxococcota bacterium]